MGNQPLSIAIASGGTGGHFYPTLAIARTAMQAGNEVTVFVAGHHSSEQLEVARGQGVPAVEVSAIRLPRSCGGLFAFPFRFLASLLEGYKALGRVRPDVVLGMGSFASVPICLAGVLRRKPLVLHEGNSLMGRANRVLSRWARACATSLPLAEGLAPPCRTVRTGMPLRDAILHAAEPNGATPAVHGDLGLSADRPTVLVFGGSQGAEFINGLLAECVQLLSAECKSVQFIHLTGTDDNAELQAAYDRAGIRAVVRRSDPNIERCYLAAGLVVCRGGASSLSELALFGKPAIVIPLPTAADDHQTVNARVLSERDALVAVSQAEVTPRDLAERIADWRQTPAAWETRGQRLHELAAPSASKAVVDLVLDVV